VALSSLVFLLSPSSTILMLIMMAFNVLQIYGFMEWWGIKVNGVSVINVVMAVGANIQYTAYLVQAFMAASGTRNERVRTANRIMLYPIVCGTVTLVLGTAPLAQAGFRYFFIYFFLMSMLITLTGYVTGTIFLPVVLSLMGPSSLSGKTAAPAGDGVDKGKSAKQNADSDHNGGGAAATKFDR